MKRFVVWFFAVSLVLTQSSALAGPHEEGDAAGRAALPGISSGISAAPTNVPSYSTTAPQQKLYGKPNLNSQANTALQACAFTPNDPVCQAQTGALKSANTPRPPVNANDPNVAAAKDVAKNPAGTLDDIASYYSGCTTTTASTGAGTIDRVCNRSSSLTNFSCSRNLKVDVSITPSCEIGEWFTEAKVDRNAMDHMWGAAQCVPRKDGKQRFKFYAAGGRGACVDWQPVDLPTAIITDAAAVADLSPNWENFCWSPFKVVEMPGSGCSGTSCNYTFQIGTPVYECAEGTTRGDALFTRDSEGNRTPVGGPDQCFSVTPPRGGEFDLSCPQGAIPIYGENGLQCATPSTDPGKLVGANGWTMPMSFRLPGAIETYTDTWDDTCPALPPGGRCEVAGSETCVDGPSTKNIGGRNVSRACWSYQRPLSCDTGQATSDCSAMSSAGCTYSKSMCVETDAAGNCTRSQDVYKCPSTGTTTATVGNCPANVFCLGGSCFNTSYTNDADFARSMSMMEAAREAGVYFDPDKLEVFKGEASSCGDRLLKNCCSSDSAGKGMTNQRMFGSGSRLVYDALMNDSNRQFITEGLTAALTSSGFSGTYSTYGITVAVNGSALPAGSTVLYASSTEAGSGFVVAFDPWSLVIAIVIYIIVSMMTCNEEESKLAMRTGAGLCHEVGSYCSHSFLGGCSTTTHAKCCFNSMLARIVNEQGRAQIGKGWGPPQAVDCSGFTVKQLQALDFGVMDLSEFYASIVPTLPNAGNIQGNNLTDATKCYYGQGKC